MLRDVGGVLAHRGEPARRRGVEAGLEILAGGGVGDLAHQGVLEEELARPGEARARALDEELGADQAPERGLGLAHADRGDARVPHREAEDAGPHHGVAARVVEGVEADLDRGLDRRRFRDVLA